MAIKFLSPYNSILSMQPLKKNFTLDFFLTLSGMWLVIFMHIPFYNLGGSGFALPQNIITWIVMASLCGGTLLFNPCRSVLVTPYLFVLIAGASFMTAPLLWSHNHEAAINSVAHYCGLWGGVLFYFCLLQVSFSEYRFRLFLWCVVLSAVIEGGIVLQTLFLPGTLNETLFRLFTNNGRSALGVFQQVNVTASWLATGFAAQMALLLQDMPETGRMLCTSWLRKAKLIATAIILVLLSTCLILTRSRVGWLGSSLCYVIFSLFLMKSSLTRPFVSAQRLVLIFAPLAGVLTGLVLLDCSVVQAMSHSASNHQRLLTLKETLKMISQHPYMGWGPGTFRTLFQEHMATHFFHNPSHELMGHPHNEILYIWFEGGICALMGYLLIMLATVWLIYKKPSIKRKITAVILLPVMLHTLTEFPLYYSAAHFFVLLIILVFLDLAGREGYPVLVASGRMKPVLIYTRFAMVLMAACIVLWLMSAFTMQTFLSHFEDGALKNPDSILHVTPPPLTAERYRHDLNLLNFFHYYATGDQKWLLDYLRVNAKWLRYHPEPDDYDNQIQVLNVTGQTETAEKYRVYAHRLFPWDSRFLEGGHAK